MSRRREQRELPPLSRNCRLEVFARSTSANTTPKPATVAGAVPLVPGTGNVPSVMLLPSGTKRRLGLKVAKVVN